MKHLLTAALVIATGMAIAQTPKRHIFYDTVKTVNTKVVFDPDTIPVFFKELIIKDTIVVEKWTAGFIIWQTYNKQLNWYNGGGSFATLVGPSNQDYYITEYENNIPIDTHNFLYLNKNAVKNKVTQHFKRTK